MELQKQRVASLLHTLSYFKNQKNSHMVKDSGLFLHHRGLSKSGQTMGSIMGCSVSNSTLTRHREHLSVLNSKSVTQCLNKVAKNKKLLLGFIDDFHNVHTIRVPTEHHASSAVSMATLLVQQVPVPAITASPDLHTSVLVDKKLCRGGIDISAVQTVISKLQQKRASNLFQLLPEELLQPNQTISTATLEELRVYNEVQHRELNKLNTTLLIDEVHQPLHSLADYEKAFRRLFLSDELLDYIKSNAVFLPGDYPTFYFMKKLIAQLPITDHRLHVVPLQGPFHVFLNLIEDIVITNHAFFANLYREVFGGILAKKPKPFRISLVIVAAYLGWHHIRSSILHKFHLSKDLEVLYILFLLDTLIPTAFVYYSKIFRTGDLINFRLITSLIAIIFIILRRKHYNKATLASISDDIHHQGLPVYEQIKNSHLSIFTEKLVELFHSVLRRHIQPHSTHQQISQRAKELSAANIDSFSSNFTNQPSSSSHSKDLTLITHKTAVFLVKSFSAIADHIGQANQSETKPKELPKYHLPGLQIDVDVRNMPLGFSFYDFSVSIPNIHVRCESTECLADENAEFKILMCGHSFHIACMPNQCPFCLKNINKRLADLSNTFNLSLLQKKCPDIKRESDCSTDDLSSSPSKSPYYHSQDFHHDLQKHINSISTLPFPAKNNIKQTQQETKQSYKQNTVITPKIHTNPGKLADKLKNHTNLPLNNLHFTELKDIEKLACPWQGTTSHGIKLINTCPMDFILSCIIISAIKSPSFRNLLFSLSNPTALSLQQMYHMLHATKSWSDIRLHWLKLTNNRFLAANLNNNTLNCWGEEMDLILSPIWNSSLGNMSAKPIHHCPTCNQTRARNPIKTLPVHKILKQHGSGITHLQTAVNEVLTPTSTKYTDSKCPQCNTTERIHFELERQPPLLLLWVYPYALEQRGIKLTDVPKHLTLATQKIDIHWWALQLTEIVTTVVTLCEIGYL
ncbi:uncharacterized protein LOC106159397 [Lingula anatina]|uniref:Uncharacterized protein LOC106159397 n=1 Tax=Lingula anatina TaxID=7574 RepID=A0A1S3HZY3_LINAN|nr:uncharacterized protein LOC106159397 [Lingula anatina]|eukprot:XP_013391131.1 uncharacterized protein LOC106159397 [Lingula anatina]